MDLDEALVLYPSPAIGHLISMVELGKLLLSYQPSLSIHILIIDPPYNAGSTASYISNVGATIPSIHFHHLPSITLPNSSTAKHHETLTFELLCLSNPNVYQTLLSISKTHSINALVIDFFCIFSLSVASQLHIPTYLFFTSGAGALALFSFLPTLHKKTTESFKNLNTFLDVPGVPPVPSSDMPLPLLDRHDKAYQYLLDFSTTIPKFAGVLANTFDLFEARALKALSDGLCIPNATTPPLYCIGPLIISNNERVARANDESVPECLTWLDSQPCGSVVFLCFGSLGLFSKEQLGEIATGLERSGQRFLWVVRNPPHNHQTLAISKQQDPDLKYLLPPGFLDRTKDRGFVVKSWAPQVPVLNHDSVGGFMTHCGWNSVLEAVCAGVPMVAWPQYAEQRFNRVMLVEEMKIALPLNESENGFVTALEVQNRVCELMDSDVGKSVRERTIAFKELAEAALRKGGSSRVALSKLVESWSRK